MREHRVAGRKRMVVELLRPRDELLAVGGREEEAAVLLVGEELDREPRQPVRLAQPAQLARRDVQLEQPVRDVRVVVEIAVPARAALAEAAPQPAVRSRERAEEEVAEPACRLDPVRPLEPPPGLRERREREPVPRRDRLVVAQRLRALLADREQPRTRRLVELAADDRAAVLERLEQLGGSAFLLGPGERQPLDAVRVGVLRRGEARPRAAAARAACTRSSRAAISR